MKNEILINKTTKDLANLSKADINQATDKMLSVAVENPREYAMLADTFEKLGKSLREKIEGYVVSELQDSGNIETSTMKIELAEVGTKYGYEISAIWRDLNNKINELTEQRKAIEKMMQICCKSGNPVTLTDAETGEQELIEGVPVRSKTSYKITRK